MSDLGFKYFLGVYVLLSTGEGIGSTVSFAYAVLNQEVETRECFGLAGLSTV